MVESKRNKVDPVFAFKIYSSAFPFTSYFMRSVIVTFSINYPNLPPLWIRSSEEAGVASHYESSTNHA
jgi:hypothetical protein